MSRLPLVNAKALEKVLFKLGFYKVRQKGSHIFTDILMGDVQ